MSITDIVANIDQRLAVLETELAQLNNARSALLELGRPTPAAKPARRATEPPAAAPAPATAAPEPTRARSVPTPAAPEPTPAAAEPQPAPAATPRPARRRTATRRPHDVVPAGKLVAVLSGSSGMGTRELAEATNGDPGQVLTLLKEREQAGQVRRSGNRRSTRWHAITDEDRIAARVAELEASSRRARQSAD